MVLDFITVSILVLFFIRGYMKGIIVAVFSVLAVLLGIICALKLSGWLAEWLLSKGWAGAGWAQLISYILLFTGVLLLVRLLAKAIQGVAGLAMLGWLNGIGGGLLYAFMAAVVWSSVLWIGDRMHLVPPETKTYSRTYSYVQPLAPKTFHLAGRLLPFAKDIFEELDQFFNGVNTTLPENVGAHR